MNEEKFEETLKKLEEAENNRKAKRKFDQSVDLIINLKNFDVRRESFNLFINLPNKIKDKNVAGFFEKKSNIIDSIVKGEFAKYKEKKDAKKLIKKYDAFISNAKLMPSVATTFGRILGPVGKMPSPQLGILPSEDENIIKAMLNKINSTVRVTVKEPSIKVSIGKVSLGSENLAKNLQTAYEKILETLPKGIDNIRNVKIKFTMGKPMGVEL